MQAFQPGLCLAQIARVLYRVAIRVGIELLQPHIHANLFASRLVVYHPVCFDGKLHILAIGPLHQTHPLDLLEGIGFTLPLLADHPKRPKPVPEGVV